jgi:hypothetical protein
METHACLKELGIDISIPTIKNHKAQIRSSAQAWIAKLAKSKRADYIAQYRERFQEIEAIQKTLWDIIKSERTGPRTKVEAANSLMKATSSLVELYDCMPVLNAIQDYGCGYNHDHDHDSDHDHRRSKLHHNQTQIDLDQLGDDSSSSSN